MGFLQPYTIALWVRYIKGQFFLSKKAPRALPQGAGYVAMLLPNDLIVVSVEPFANEVRNNARYDRG